jgi:hypothetical protein
MLDWLQDTCTLQATISVKNDISNNFLMAHEFISILLCDWRHQIQPNALPGNTHP